MAVLLLNILQWTGQAPQQGIIQPNMPVMPRWRSPALHIFYLEHDRGGTASQVAPEIPTATYYAQTMKDKAMSPKLPQYLYAL